MQSRRAVVLTLVIGLASCRGGGDDPAAIEPRPWHTPTCESISGPPVATFSPDRGITVRPHNPPVDEPTFRTLTIAVASEVAVLYATHGRGIYISHDAGCTWNLVHEHESRTFNIVAGERKGFAWMRSSGSMLVFDHDGLVASRHLPQSPEELVTSPSDPDTIYLVPSGGSAAIAEQLWRSRDRGRSWGQVGSEQATPNAIQRLAINPNDSQHLVATRLREQVAISFDGGNTWMDSEGIDRGAFSWTTWPIVFGSDGLTHDIWVAGVRTFRDDDLAITHTENFVARSVDGGLTFADAFRSGDGIAISNQTNLATIPGVAGEVFANNRDCPILTPRLIHYRASDDSVTILDHGDRRFGFSTLAFHPVDPDVLYLGYFENACPS